MTSIKRRILLAAILLSGLCANAGTTPDTLFVYLKSGGLHAFPASLTAGQTTEDGSLVIRTTAGTEFTYPLTDVAGMSGTGPDTPLPYVTSFTIESRHNDDIFEDIEADITGDSLITAAIPSIGRWLTPSFGLSDASASAYIGDERQVSGESRSSYRDEVTLVVARPDELVLSPTGDDGKGAPALMPLGRRYRIKADWLTDRATNVPRMDIDIENGEMVSSKEVYLSARLTIDGAGVFPSMEATDVQIKGRGNSSWSDDPWAKNPYRLKFLKKQAPFGLTKGKSWVLQANKQTHSMMANAVGMKIARLVGTLAANHVIPVELYVNGGYRGSYVFTEKVGVSANSIEADDESVATLLELDTYYDEDYKFRSTCYDLPVNISHPDFSEDETSLSFEDIQADFNRVTDALYAKEDIQQLVDIDMTARYLMVNELIANYEIEHPKSTYVYKADVTDTGSKYIFGPVWDLDYAFGYETGYDYGTADHEADFWTAKSNKMRGWTFIDDLRHGTGEVMDRAYYKVWNDFMENHLQEVIDFCADYYRYARPSFEHNASMWSDGRGYAEVSANMTSWLKTRAEHVYSGLTPYDVTEPDNPSPAGIVSAGCRTDTPRADVYSMSGMLIRRGVPLSELRKSLPAGLYIVNGRKLAVGH